MEVAEEFNRDYREYGAITMPQIVDEDLLERVMKGK